MAAKIALEVTTPDGVALHMDVDELTVPSVEGEFGVLPGHLPVLAGLKTGLLKAIAGGETHEFAIGPGFAQIADERASVLTDHFVAKSDVDPIIARKELKEAEEELAAMGASTPETELFPAIARARWAAVRLELYGDPPPATIMMALETRLLSHEEYSQASAAEGAARAEQEGSAQA